MEEPIKKNTGVIDELPDRLDFRVGKESGIKYEDRLKGEEWDGDLPNEEPQSFAGFDTSGCVTFSAFNSIETQVDWMIRKGILTGPRLQLLRDWGFFDANGKFNASDRFTAKMSGTTPEGNTLKRVWDSIHTDGLVPESMWPAKGVTSWAEWNKEIPQDVKDFGKKILDILDFQYEWVVTGNCGPVDKELLKKHLKQAPLQIAHIFCGTENGVTAYCGVCIAQHATIIYKVEDYFFQFDHYAPFKKKLAPDYKIPYAMKGLVILKEEPQIPTPSEHQFDVNVYINYGEESENVLNWQKALIQLGFKTFETGKYYGWTQDATKAFQIKYKVADIKTINRINGRWAGPATLAKMNELLQKKIVVIKPASNEIKKTPWQALLSLLQSLIKMG